MFAITFAYLVAITIPLIVMIVGGYVAFMAIAEAAWHLATNNLSDSQEFGKGMGLAGAGLMAALWVWIMREQLHDMLLMLV